MLLSPLLAAMACALTFWYAVRRFRVNTRRALDELAGYLFFGLTLGFVASVAAAFVLIFVQPSAQAPFALMLFPPVGLALGAVIATGVWLVHVKEA